MTRFTDGPAAGKTLMLRRAPVFLRVVRNAKGEWDALDQLGDQPEPSETIVAYRKVKDDGWVHLRSAKRGASGFYLSAQYAVVDPQPDDSTMRSTQAWRAWCYEQVGKAVPA
jgi:hypothetical protein